MATLHVERLSAGGPLPLVELRETDLADCEAAGVSPQEALAVSVRLSAQAWQVVYDGQTLGYWGHAPVTVLGNVGVMWFLSSPGADHHPLVTGRLSYSYVAYVLSLYNEIFVQVALSNKRSRRWLRWLGFMEVSRSGRFATMRKARR